MVSVAVKKYASFVVKFLDAVQMLFPSLFFQLHEYILIL
jgi:hypothetical protein